jgi:glutamate decarboxylase
MLHDKQENKKQAKVNLSAILSLYDDIDIPKYELSRESISEKAAYQLIKNELLDEGNARLNLATFCSSYMEDEAIRLMAETLEKNAIDKSEYPSTIEIENRCVNIIADLWNAGEGSSFIGTSTVGSSEACMLSGLAMKFRWRNRAEALGLEINSRKPNLIISSGYQVCWEKFCVYWDVELRSVPINKADLNLDINMAMSMADEFTIGIVAILGHTYTGKFDDIETLDKAVSEYNSKTQFKIPIHVDGASGGLFVPFVNPELRWDFRLENVISINTSGHKYGLVYPGIGWLIWKDKMYLPKELVFEVSYLGGSMPTMALNFSRSASHIIGQYYCFLRMGFNGYRKIHLHTQHVAMYISKELQKTKLFHIYNNGENLPVVCFKLQNEADTKWTLFNLSDRIEMKGWQMPVYHMPDNISDTVVSRIVCRSDFTLNLAERFIGDLLMAIEVLSKATILSENLNSKETKGFKH